MVQLIGRTAKIPRVAGCAYLVCVILNIYAMIFTQVAGVLPVTVELNCQSPNQWESGWADRKAYE